MCQIEPETIEPSTESVRLVRMCEGGAVQADDCFTPAGFAGEDGKFLGWDFAD